MAKISIDHQLSKKTADTIRLLSADGVQKANSGHPGMPMGMADIATVLWTKYLKYNPKDTAWANRDRFVLSGGHGSMLIYSLLHLAGYDLSLDDLKSFRQWGSKTPGHPEVDVVPGVETTTGPLGQGFTNAIGMAIAAKMTAAQFKTDLLGTHHVYSFCGDGDMMEGLTSEAASIAGHLGLGNIIFFYDSNRITIEGDTNLAFSESVKERFLAYNWHVLEIDGHNHDEIADAIEKGQNETDKPTLVIAKTHIGFGSPNKHDTSGIHGAPLGDDEIRATKKALGFPEDKSFYVPDEARALFADHVKNTTAEYDAWEKDFEVWKSENSDLAAVYEKMMNKFVPQDLTEKLVDVLPEKTNATRNLSGIIMQKIAEEVPSFIGGSADLDPSTKTFLKAFTAVQKGQYGGRNFHFGIREHAMGSINNGIALYGGYIPFGSTFMVFSDYMRPSFRLAALMKLQNIFIYTHDSIFVGEDGPTHQPVEHLAALRIIPNLQVLRPADGVETAVCWAMAMESKDKPTALLLTRQTVPALDRLADFTNDDIRKGAYVVSQEKNGDVETVILTSGSEVGFAIDAQKILEAKGKSVRVVSVPCKELFEKQSVEYRRSLIPESTKAIAIVEAGISFGWQNYFELPLIKVTIDDRFGASGPYKLLEEKFGFTPENIAEKIEAFYKG
jgi:transketolase